jgi:segregation and condensation protein B
METLAIVAYHQPVTRGEIEEIRGVQVSKGTLDVLFEQGWIAPKGRRETPGRPVTWVTTDSFLRHFGLATLNDLPNIEELRAAGLLDARPAIQVLRPDAADAVTADAAFCEASRSAPLCTDSASRIDERERVPSTAPSAPLPAGPKRTG